MTSPAMRRQTRADHRGLRDENDMGNTTPPLSTLCTETARVYTRDPQPTI